MTTPSAAGSRSAGSPSALAARCATTASARTRSEGVDVRSFVGAGGGVAEPGQEAATGVVDEDDARLDAAVDDTAAMGRHQRRRHIANDGHNRRRRERRRSLDGGQRAGRGQRRDLKRAVGLSPVVAQRNDVGVLEPRRLPRLHLEAPDESGVVGELLTDHRDGHLSTHRGLVGAVGHPQRAGADLLPQLVAAYAGGSRPTGGSAVHIEGRVAPHHLVLELHHGA